MTLPREMEEYLKQFDLEQNLQIPPIDDAMSDLRQRIEPNFQETVGFEYDSEKPYHSEKTKDIFRRAFAKFLSFDILDRSDVNLMEAAKLLENEIHHRLKTIRIIENKILREMYMEMSRTYEIHHNNTLFFHGTTAENVDKIIRTGFNELMCERDLWGKGIYLGTTVNHGMLYADPLAKGLQKKQLEEGDLTQYIVVCYVLKGHTAVGQKGQIDFGFTNEGKEITTLTDFRETMIVVSRKSQILPIAVIEIEYQPDRKYTPEIKHRMGNFHPYIAELIRQKLTAGAGVEQLTKHAVTSGREITFHSGFGKGDKVKLTSMPQKFKVLNGQEGTIKMIVHFGRFPRFLVELDNANNDLAKKFNDTRGIILSSSLNAKEHWLICLKEYLIHIYPQAPVKQTGESSSSMLGKRPAT